MPSGSAMLATGGGAWYFPPQAAIKASRAILFTVFSSVMVSQPGTCDHGDREARKRVLENVFEGAVVEEVLDLDVEPDRSYGADAGPGVEEQRTADEGRVEGVPRQRGGKAHLPVPFHAVAPLREAREHPMGRAVGQAVPVDAGLSDVERLHPPWREQLVEDQVPVARPEHAAGERQQRHSPFGAGV